MITLNGFPKNKDKYIRLIGFFKEILGICKDLSITPVLDGSLAVLAYTKNQNMEVNDVDTSVPESEYPKIIKVLKKRGINYKLREWHVLQVLKDDLKIELGSGEYYLKDLPKDYEMIQVDDYRIKILSLSALREFYRRGMEVRAKGNKENDKIKYERLKANRKLLSAI